MSSDKYKAIATNLNYNNKAFISNVLPAYSIANHMGVSARNFEYYIYYPHFLII